MGLATAAAFTTPAVRQGSEGTSVHNRHSLMPPTSLRVRVGTARRPCLAEGLHGVTPSGLAALGHLPHGGGGLRELNFFCYIRVMSLINLKSFVLYVNRVKFPVIDVAAIIASGIESE